MSSFNVCAARPLASPFKPPQFEILYSSVLNADSGGLSGRAMRMAFNAAGHLTTGNRVRVTFEAGSTEGITIGVAYIGYTATASGTNRSGLITSPHQLFFGGNPGIAIAAGMTAVSDELPFHIDGTRDITVMFHLGDVSHDIARIGADASNPNTEGWNKVTSEGATPNHLTSDYSATNDIIGVKLVEAFDTGSAEYFTAIDNGIGGNNGGWGSYNQRIIIPANHIVKSGTKVKVTFRSGSSALALSSAYIGLQAAAGDAWDFASAPTQLLFGGVASKTASGASAEFTSDEAAFVIDGSTAIIIACHATNGDIYGITSIANGIRGQYKAGADEGSTVDATGYTAHNVFNFRKLEIFG